MELTQSYPAMYWTLEYKAWKEGLKTFNQPDDLGLDLAEKRKEYDPNQPRDYHGRWTVEGGGEGSPQESSLKNAKVKSSEPLYSGVHSGKAIVTLTNGSKAIFKPSKGEDPGIRFNIEVGQASEREIAAWETAKLVGMQDMVMAAVPYTFDGREGVLLSFQPGEIAGNFSEPTAYDGYKDMARAAAFDYVVGNEDRHDGNWLVDEHKHLHLIDHNLTFPEGKAEVDRGFVPHIRHEEENAGPTARIPSPKEMAKPYVQAQNKIDSLLERLHLPESAIEGVRARILEMSTAEHWKDLRLGIY